LREESRPSQINMVDDSIEPRTFVARLPWRRFSHALNGSTRKINSYAQSETITFTMVLRVPTIY
jgi:hypothetical protein